MTVLAYPCKPNTLSDVLHLPRLDVTALLPKLRTGDLLFASGQAVLSKTIQRLTDSPWSHCAMILRVGDEVEGVFVLESHGLTGVRLSPLLSYVQGGEGRRAYHGRIVLARWDGLQPVHARQILNSGLMSLRQMFGYTQLLRIGYLILQAKPRRYDGATHQFLCSELVHACLQHAGLPVFPDDRGFVSPASLWRHQQVYLLGRVR
ncbi:MAG: hypothetical protein RLY58_2320 [Pseudomonadota bacterium]|jgi:hypothetical protein